MLTAIAALVIGLGPQTPLHCVTTLESITGAPATTMSYGGAIFGTCCAGCDGPFLKDPKAAIAKAVKANKAIGAFRFDPVSGKSIDGKKTAAYSDYRAIRYYFASADEKKAFDAKPSNFVGDIKAESTQCPVSKEEVAADMAFGYKDVDGVRYYICCGNCAPKFNAEPAKFVVGTKTQPLAAAKIK